MQCEKCHKETKDICQLSFRGCNPPHRYLCVDCMKEYVGEENIKSKKVGSFNSLFDELNNKYKKK